MDLVIDIGNTNTKAAIFPDEENDFHEEIIFTIEGVPELSFLEQLMSDYPQVENCIISSVVHHSSAINQILSKKMNLLEMGKNIRLPLVNKYLTPETLGHDRIAAAVAGYSMFPKQNVLVINAGTCIIYDFVSASGEYLGGSISPGMMMRFNALHTFTGKLPLITPEEHEPFMGNTTAGSMMSGVFTGITAEMEGFAERYAAVYPDLKVILSGGDLNYFDKRLKINIFAFPNIVIHGLHQILKFNVFHSH